MSDNETIQGAENREEAMNTPRYVQHISGQGEKHKVEREKGLYWLAESPEEMSSYYFLPKPEYRECPPPHRRVTGECSVAKDNRRILCHKAGDANYLDNPNRGWKLVTREDLAPGEVCIVIEEGE
jgi:hypothetical protein